MTERRRIAYPPRMPYDAESSERREPIQPCDHCGADDEPVHPVQTGGGFLVLCAACRAEAVGGS